MSNILISGCGISFCSQRRPSWTKVLKICGVNIIDTGGPAISNEYILNKTISTLNKLDTKPDKVICQLTGTGKLDIDVSNIAYLYRRDELIDNGHDPLRNFEWEGLWPSSDSTEGPIKKFYYKWIYSEKIEIQNIIIKLLALDFLCKKHEIELIIMQGYDIRWPTNKNDPYYTLLHQIEFDKKFVIYNYYKESEYYQYHDHRSGNNVPCKQFAVHFAKKMNNDFLHLDINNKLKKFNA